MFYHEKKSTAGLLSVSIELPVSIWSQNDGNNMFLGRLGWFAFLILGWHLFYIESAPWTIVSNHFDNCEVNIIWSKNWKIHIAYAMPSNVCWMKLYDFSLKGQDDNTSLKKAALSTKDPPPPPPPPPKRENHPQITSCLTGALSMDAARPLQWRPWHWWDVTTFSVWNILRFTLRFLDCTRRSSFRTPPLPTTRWPVTLSWPASYSKSLSFEQNCNVLSLI